jgi:6-pyruvoyl-tetrahydropterin synthase
MYEDGVCFLTFKPTAENLAMWIFEEVSKKLPKGVKVTKVVLYETPTSFVTITRRNEV